MEPLSPIPAITGPAPEPDRAQANPERALTLAVAGAARRLNDINYAGEGREITFSLDPATKKPLVKVVDLDTREVVFQWPSKYLLELAAEHAGNDAR
jgi:uncharacterized FlaG/YvyC family protein